MASPLSNLAFAGGPPRSDFARLRCDGHPGLSLRWLALLESPETRKPVEHLIELFLRDGLFELGACAGEQLLLAPAADNSGNGCVSIEFALFVQRVTPDCDEADADCTEHDDHKEDYAKNGEEVFHMRDIDLTRKR